MGFCHGNLKDKNINQQKQNHDESCWIAFAVVIALLHKPTLRIYYKDVHLPDFLVFKPMGQSYVDDVTWSD